jgi:hypothetical protein
LDCGKGWELTGILYCIIEKKIDLPYNQGLQSCEETYMIEIMGKKFFINK